MGSHRRPISIGDASSLFGGSGGGEDFFGGPASKPPAFGAVQEEEEDSSRDNSRDLVEQQLQSPYANRHLPHGNQYGTPQQQQHTSQGAAAYAQRDHYAYQPQSGYAQQDGFGQPNAYAYGQQSGYGGDPNGSWQQQQPPPPPNWGQQQAYGQQYANQPYGQQQQPPQPYQNQHAYGQQPQSPQQGYPAYGQQHAYQQTHDYGSYSSPQLQQSQQQAYAPQGQLQSSVGSSTAYNPYGQQAQNNYSPAVNAYPAGALSPPLSSSAGPRPTSAPAPPASQPPRPQTYDAYDPPPVRRKPGAQLGASQRSAASVTTPTLPMGDPSFGQHMNRIGSPASQTGSLPQPARGNMIGQGQGIRNAGPIRASDPPLAKRDQPQHTGGTQLQGHGMANPPPQRPDSQQSQTFSQGSYRAAGPEYGTNRYEAQRATSQSPARQHDPYSPPGHQRQRFPSAGGQQQSFSAAMSSQTPYGVEAQHVPYGQGPSHHMQQRPPVQQQTSQQVAYNQGQQHNGGGYQQESGGQPTWQQDRPQQRQEPFEVPTPVIEDTALEDAAEEEYDYEQLAAAYAADAHSEPVAAPDPTSQERKEPQPAPYAYDGQGYGLPPGAGDRYGEQNRDDGGEERWAASQTYSLPPASQAATSAPSGQRHPGVPTPAAQAPLPAPMHHGRPPPRAVAGPVKPSSIPGDKARTPALASTPGGKTVADFQTAVGVASPAGGLQAATRDPTVLATFGHPQPTVPEPPQSAVGIARGPEGESTTVDSSQRLQTPPPPPSMNRKSAKPELVNGTRMEQTAQQARVAVSPELRQSLAFDHVTEQRGSMTDDAGANDRRASLNSSTAAAAASAAAAAEEVEAQVGVEDDDAWGFDEDPEGLTGVISADPSQSVAAPQQAPPPAHNVENTWGLEDGTTSVDGMADQNRSASALGKNASEAPLQETDALAVPAMVVQPATPVQARDRTPGEAVLASSDASVQPSAPPTGAGSFNVLADLDQPSVEAEAAALDGQGLPSDDVPQQDYGYSPEPYTGQAGFEDYQYGAGAQDRQPTLQGQHANATGEGYDLSAQAYGQPTSHPEGYAYQDGYAQSYEFGNYEQQYYADGYYGGASGATAGMPSANGVADSYAHSYGANPPGADFGGQGGQDAEYLKDGYYGYSAAGMGDFAAADPTYAPQADFDDQYLPSQAGSAAHFVGADPLDRCRARIALASFGFGGKLVTVFPSTTDGSVYGTSLSTNGPSVTIRNIKTVVPVAALDAYPGPLFMDGGSKASAGKKRKEILAWLDGRIEEADKRCVYLQGTRQMAGTTLAAPQESGTADRQSLQAAERAMLLRLVKVLVENEGKLFGKKAEDPIHAILRPESGSAAAWAGSLPTADQLTSAAGTSDPSPTVTTYTVRGSHLDQIEASLASGQRQDALSFAIEHRLWAHAFIIANSLGGSSWMDAVHEFVRSELGSSSASNPSGGRASLRTLYSLFAGGGAFAVEHFLPPKQLSPGPGAPPSLANGQTLGSPGAPGKAASRSASPSLRPPVGQLVPVSADILREWRSTVALVVANRVVGDSQFLVGIGETLAQNSRPEAAHICYLLSAQNLFGGSDDRNTRVDLLGADSSAAIAAQDIEAIMLTEVVEFALSLVPTPKGQEPFPGLPHLQGHKLALAQEYAASGIPVVGQKYCDAITATLKLAQKSSPYYHPSLLTQVKCLSDRLNAAPAQEKGASWVSRKMQRPTLEGVWSTLEGRFSKFVAGDGEEPVTPQRATAQEAPGTTLGPFSHYSSISPGSTSGQVSRAPSTSDLLSAARAAATPGPHLPLSEAVASPPPTIKPMPPIVPAGPLGKVTGPVAAWKKGHHQRSSSLGAPHGYSYDPYSPPSWGAYSGGAALSTPVESSPDPGAHAGGFEPPPETAERLSSEQHRSQEHESQHPQAAGGGGGWWNSASDGGATAYEPQSYPAAELSAAGDDGAGFIDPMAGFGSPALPSDYEPSFSGPAQNATTYDDVDDQDDLGLGNTKRQEPSDEPDKENAPENETSSPPQQADARLRPENAARPALKPAPSSSWIGRWFKKEANAPAGPIRAKLGDEVSLVYDPETKRWVSKKPGGATPAATPSPPPPPARAQTASPSSAMRGLNGSASPAVNSMPPPPRSAGSTPIGPPNGGGAMPPPPSGLRNAASANVLGAPPPTPPLPPGSAPPPSTRRPGGAAAKKHLRARYVEIS